MANGWTDARKARQAVLIHRWQPWTSSTGARTDEGKAISSRNAFRPTMRKHWLLQCWLCKQMKHLRAGRACASIEATMQIAKQYGIELEG
jgi:hypothetical protein